MDIFDRMVLEVSSMIQEASHNAFEMGVRCSSLEGAKIRMVNEKPN